MISLVPDQLDRILCLGAHADDIEIGCGGTLLRLLDERPELEICWVVFAADGERAAEARDSAERFLHGAAEKEIRVEGFRDTFFPYQGEQIKEYFCQLGRHFWPDLVFTHRLEDRHQDHRLLAELTWNTFRNHLVLEYEIPKYEGDLGQPNLFVPLREEICRQKIDALHEAFASQREKPWFTPDTFWSLLRIRGLECHSKSRYAEAFTARKLVV